MATTVYALPSGRVRTTFPAALARETEFRDLAAESGVAFDVHRDGDGLDLEIRFGLGVDPDDRMTIQPLIRERQIEVDLPRFWAHAWGLVDCSIDWPDADHDDAFTISGDGTMTIRAPVEGWTPVQPVAVFEATREVATTQLSESGQARDIVEGSIPVGAARRLGLLEDGVNARVSLDRVDGRDVFVLTPTRAELEGNPAVLSVEPHGNQQGQARFKGGKIATVLGVRDRVREDSVELGWWIGADGYVVGFVSGV